MAPDRGDDKISISNVRCGVNVRRPGNCFGEWFGGMRDLRLDFFRGLALYMVVLDHAGNNPLNYLTYQRIGFSDAAEIFIFVSGITCGLVYSSRLDRGGWGITLRSLCARAGKIYVYYASSSTAAILLAAAATAVWGSRIQSPDFGGIIRLSDVHTDIWLAILMISPPATCDILVFYVAMTLVGVPILLAGFRSNPAMTLVASAGIWLLAQIFAPYEVSFEGYWIALNPLAWQFLLAIGMFFGTNPRAFSAANVPGPMLCGAWAVVAIAVLYKFLVSVIAPHFGLDLQWMTLSHSTLIAMKMNLSIFRLIHFLSVALLVTRYIGPGSKLIRWPGFALVIQTGARPLELYSLSIVLSVLANIFVRVYRPSIESTLLLDLLVFALMGLTAASLCRAPAMAGWWQRR